MQEVENRCSGTMPTDWNASFGEVDAMLASVNELDSSRRTAFQARLKHFLRLGALPNVKQGRGKASSYSAGDVITMATLCDLTRFGITPESAVAIVENGEFIFISATYRSLPMLEISEDEYWNNSESDPIFLFFGPNALSVLSENKQTVGLYWGGFSFISSDVIDTTRGGQTRQLSLMNFTTLLRVLVGTLKGERRDAFIESIAQWAQAGVDRNPHRSVFPGYEVE